MSKITGFYFKRKFIFSFIFSVLISVIFSMIYIESGTINSQIRNSESLYVNSKIDFVIPSPTYNQVEDLKNMDHINNVVGFSYGKISVNINEKNISQQEILVFNDFTNLENTPYCESRIIEREEEAHEGVFVDYEFAKLYNIKLGDEISLSIRNTKFNYKVSRIYETNILYNKGTLVLEMNNVLDSIFNGGNIKSFSSAYVSSKDYTASRNYFINEYKPLGRLKDKSEFKTDDEYNKYVEEFNKISFALEIQEISNKFAAIKIENEQLQNKVHIYQVLTYILPAILVIFYMFLFRQFRFEKEFLNANRKNYLSKNNNIYLLIDSLFILIVSVSINLILSFMQLNNIDFYFVMSDFDNLNIYYCLSITVGILLSTLLFSTKRSKV